MNAVFFIALLFQPPGTTTDAITVTISPQTSPYALPKGTILYSAVACASTSAHVRVISAGQIRQIAEGAGIAFTDPQLVPPMVTRYVGQSLKGRLLAVVNDINLPGAVVSDGVAAIKTQFPGSNARTWAYVGMGESALAMLLPMAQKHLQADTQSQQATITNGVQSAMITSMEAVYTVPVAGCSKSVMFLGNGPSAIAKVVLP